MPLDSTRVWFDHDTQKSIDEVFVREDGEAVGLYSRETKEQFAKRYPNIGLMGVEAAMAAERLPHLTGPQEIDEDKYTYALEVLPPCRFVVAERVQSFFVSEAVTMDIHAWYVRLGRRFFTLQQSRAMKTDEIVQLCREYADANRQSLGTTATEVMA